MHVLQPTTKTTGQVHAQRHPEQGLPSRIFVASSAGVVSARREPAATAGSRRRPAGVGPTHVPVPQQRRRSSRGHPLVPPGRHAQSRLTPGWRLAADLVLAVVAIAVLLLAAVVATQQPT